MKQREIIYRAANGWTVRQIRYSTIRGRLVPDCAGEKWFEIFDAQSHNHSNYLAGEQPLETLHAIADKGE